MKKDNIIRYKGYYAKIDYIAGKNVLVGHVENVDADIRFECSRPGDVKKDFKEAVHAYLNECSQKGVKPEKTYKGSFNVRIHPECHKRLSHAAIEEDVSLNALVEEALCDYLDRRFEETGPIIDASERKQQTDDKETDYPFES